MKFKFINISVISPENGEEKLNALCAKHRIISVEKQLISQGNSSFWSVCVNYLEGLARESKALSNNNRGRIDYKELLNEQDFVIFAELRK